MSYEAVKILKKLNCLISEKEPNLILYKKAEYCMILTPKKRQNYGDIL